MLTGMGGSVLQNLRTVYDKNGKSMVSGEGGSNVEDAASFFANVFGGDRFMDYVCVLPVIQEQGGSLTTNSCRFALYNRSEKSR
jgi:hypothetical protein